MDYNIYSKDVTVTDSMKDYIDKRFSKVSKVVNEEKLISMDLWPSKERAFYKVEATAHLPRYGPRGGKGQRLLYSSGFGI